LEVVGDAFRAPSGLERPGPQKPGRAGEVALQLSGEGRDGSASAIRSKSGEGEATRWAPRWVRLLDVVDPGAWCSSVELEQSCWRLHFAWFDWRVGRRRGCCRPHVTPRSAAALGSSSAAPNLRLPAQKQPAPGSLLSNTKRADITRLRGPRSRAITSCASATSAHPWWVRLNLQHHQLGIKSSVPTWSTTRQCLQPPPDPASSAPHRG
jgi:hypothetical protein